MAGPEFDIEESWYPFDRGRTKGERGPENGTIIRDEAFKGEIRITVERDTPTAPFAILCSIGGWLMHTEYFSSAEEAQQEFEVMKSELVRIWRLIPHQDDPEAASKYPEVARAMRNFMARYGL